MNSHALSYIVLTGFLLGTNVIAARFGINQFEPIAFVGLRMVIAGLAFLTLYIFHQRHRWPTNPYLWGHATVLGIFGNVVPLVTIVSAMQYQSSGITAILITLSPAFTVLLAHFFFADEPLTRIKGIGVFLAMSGALLLVVRGENGLPDVTKASPLGYGLTAISLICFSGVTIYMRKFMRGFDSFSVTSIQIFVGALIVFPLALLLTDTDWQGISQTTYMVVLYTGLVGTFGGYMLFFFCVKYFGASRAATVDYIAPIVATLGGVLLLGEEITLGMWVSIAIIALGIVLINYRERSVEIEPI